MGTVKAFNVPFDYVLHEMSYVNVMMYGSVLPSYDSKKDKKDDDEIINADDPANKDKIRRILYDE